MNTEQLVLDKTELYKDAINAFSGKIACQVANAMANNMQILVNQNQINASIQEIALLFDLPFIQVQHDLSEAVNAYDLGELRFVMALKKQNMLH